MKSSAIAFILLTAQRLPSGCARPRPDPAADRPETSDARLRSRSPLGRLALRDLVVPLRRRPDPVREQGRLGGHLRSRALQGELCAREGEELPDGGREGVLEPYLQRAAGVALRERRQA